MKKKRYSGLYGDWCAVKYLTEEEAVEEFLKIMEEYIDSYQYKISDEVLKYQFDFSPVVVNMTKDGRVKLIDGFKRLLLVADDKLDYDVPVIVYNDLNDEDYLTILFAANAWKVRTGQNGSFYDRGFLFGQYLFKVFIETVGQYRVIGKHFEDLDLSKIFNDYLDRHRKEIFKKINMSVPGYIENHFKPEANRDFNFKL